MAQDLCRICLDKENLLPIFDEEGIHFQAEDISTVTGVNIKPNDGLPQTICAKCSRIIKDSFELRSKAKESEISLLELGYRILIDNRQQSIDSDSIENDLNITEEFSLPSEDIPDTSNVGETSNSMSDDRSEHKNVGKKNRKKQEYLNLVEGAADLNGPIKCRLCKKVLSKWSTFVCHAKLHLGLKYVCEHCGKSFISSFQLNRHSRALHGLARQLTCATCSYMALDNAQMTLHIRRVHTGLRPYACADCGAAYHSRKCLIQHIEGHNTERSVQCQKCARTFKSSRHLSRHVYSVHSSKEFLYTCPICRKTFRNQKYSRTHLKKAHGLSSADVCIIKNKV